MVIDFIAAAILIICIINGERRGVIESFASAFGWLFSLFFALFYSPTLADFLNEKANLSTTISDAVLGRIKDMIANGSTLPESAADHLPSVVSQAMANSTDSALEQAARPVADNLAGIFVSIVAFFLILVVVKLLIRLLERLIRGFHKAKKVGAVDGILGMLFGILKGGVLIYILISCLLLAASVTAYEPLVEMIQSSVCIDFIHSRGFLFFGEDIVDGIELPQLSF